MLETIFQVIVILGGMFILLVIFAIINAMPTTTQIAERERRGEELSQSLLAKREWREMALAGLSYPTEGYLLNSGATWDCTFALDEGQRALRVFGYTVKGGFAVTADATVMLDDVISIEIVRPTKTKQVKRTQHVPIVTSKKKSPVARGIVGGALLGPAGLVLGAASGIGKDVSTKVEERTVWEDVEAQGDPELHLGTTNLDTPLIKLRPISSAAAEEWMHRINALRATVGVAGSTASELPAPD